MSVLRGGFEYNIMTVRERIERQDRIEINIDWARHWNALVDSLPDLLKSPWRMAELAMWVLNLGLQ